MSTAVVTGGAGFLGSHLCDFLLTRGHRVICIDNLDTGSLQNVEHVESDRFTFLNQDVTQRIELDEPVDLVFHLASPASPIDYMRLPLQTLKVGSYGTHNALGLAKFKRARFLLASTSEVYGDPNVHPQPETYWGNVNPIGPRGVYDEAKRYAEALTMAYHRQQGVNTAIARIFNTYGPRMRPHDGRAIPTFVRQALENKPLTVFGDGSQTRSFCYVDDLIRGLYALATSGEHLPVNLGNPHEMTLLELAETVVRATGATSEIVFEALPVDDPQVRQPDITRAKQVLGWEPEVVARGRAAEAARGARPRARPGRCRPLGSPPSRRRSSVALAAAGTGSASPQLQVGLYDEAQTLYGNPEETFPVSAPARRARAPGQPLLEPSRALPAGQPANPSDLAYNWARTTGRRSTRSSTGSSSSSRSSGRPRGRTPDAISGTPPRR